jgi:hypothetical protein
MGDLFALGSSFEIYRSSPNIWDTVFYCTSYIYMHQFQQCTYFFTVKGTYIAMYKFQQCSAKFWAIFLPTHLVTLKVVKEKFEWPKLNFFFAFEETNKGSTEVILSMYIFLVTRWIQRCWPSLRLPIVWKPFWFLLFSRLSESLLEVLISPCFNHSGCGRTSLCTYLPWSRLRLKQEHKFALQWTKPVNWHCNNYG